MSGKSAVSSTSSTSTTSIGDIASLPPGRQKTVGLHQGAKSLIRNVIRHTDTHNRLLEESEMWQTFYRLKREKPDEPDKAKTTAEETATTDDKGQGLREPDIKNSFLYDDRKDMRWEGPTRRGTQRAHMDDICEGRQNDTGFNKSTFWMRQLQKVEDKDPERWGHAGFKELYPDAFDSDRSAGDDKSHKKKPVKKSHTKREHRHRSSDRKRKRRRSESDKVRRKKRPPRRHKDDSGREKRHRKRKQSNEREVDSSIDHSEKDKRNKKRKHSTETSESDSETDEESKKKKSRRNIKIEGEREKKESKKRVVHKSHRQKKKRKH